MLVQFLAFGFLVGVLLGAFSQPRASGRLLAVGLVIAVISRLTGAWPRIPLATLVALLVGWAFTSSWRLSRQVAITPNLTYHLTGVIAEPPDVRADKIQLTLQVTSGLSPTRILVSADRYPTWRYGDEVQLDGTIERPQPFNGFNYPLYLERFGIHGLLRHPKDMTLVSHNRGSPFLAILYRVRDGVENLIRLNIPEPEASFLGGILLGSKQSIPDKIQADLRQTGTSHIIAISGANITILLGILLAIAPIYSPKRQFVAILGLSLFVALLTGASASVMRGALVACLGRYLRLISRRSWATPFILTSVVILVMGNPLLLAADPGFQLSFAAFAGLLYLGSPIKLGLERLRPLSQLPEVVKASLAETLAATLGTAPLSLILFHQLSLLGLVVNPLILWLIPAITGLGLILAGFSWITPVGMLVKLPLWVLLHTVLTIISSFGQLQVGVIHTA
jgi:competence protein ComEC